MNLTNLNVDDDIVKLFFEALDYNGHLVNRNKLTRQEYAKAISMRWPSHDQHLIAAAAEADRCCIAVTEQTHKNCKRKLKKNFNLDLEELPVVS